MRICLTCALGLGLSVATAAAAAEPPPRVACNARGLCSVSRLPALSDPETQGHLKSGLTSTLALTVSMRSADGKSEIPAGRVDVRFEPWDEIFHVLLVPAVGPTQARQLGSLAELQAFWRGLDLAFQRPGPRAASARVELSVIPFSEDEEADARRWYAEAVRGKDVSGERTSQRATRLGEVLDTLTLTSIKREGVLSFSWSVAVEE